VPNGDDADNCVIVFITDHVGLYGQKLAPSAFDLSFSPWKNGEAIASRYDLFRFALGCLGVESSDVVADGNEISNSLGGPFDYRRFRADGGGTSCGLPQERSHFTTSAWGMVRPAAMSASPRFIARPSAAASGG
jgi:hypothetical protein